MHLLFCSGIIHLLNMINFVYGTDSTDSTLLDSLLIEDWNVTREESDDEPWDFFQQSFDKPVIASRVNRSFSPMNLRVSNEEDPTLPYDDCPGVYCYTFQNRTSRQIVLTCQSFAPAIDRLISHISCKYRKQSAIPTSAFYSQHQPKLRQDQVYDLKVALSSVDTGSSRRPDLVSVDLLTPNVLNWLIRHLRSQLNMHDSPVHLTLTLIHVSTFRRSDLGDLSSQSHVTRLNIQSPGIWEEDSLMPIDLIDQYPAFIKVPLLPPYFRLTITCDRNRRITKFRRLWIPWQSWQLRFIDCPALNYECRLWVSKYPICSREGAFMPKYFVFPNFGNQIGGLGNQILFHDQCEQQTTVRDPVDDLEFDVKVKCWRPDGYSRRKSMKPSSLPNITTTTETHKTTSPERTSLSLMSDDTNPFPKKNVTSPTFKALSSTATQPRSSTTAAPVYRKRLPITTTPKSTTSTTTTRKITKTHSTAHTAVTASPAQAELKVTHAYGIANDVKPLSVTHLLYAVIVLSCLVFSLVLTLVLVILLLRCNRTRRSPPPGKFQSPYFEDKARWNLYESEEPPFCGTYYTEVDPISLCKTTPNSHRMYRSELQVEVNSTPKPPNHFPVHKPSGSQPNSISNENTSWTHSDAVRAISHEPLKTNGHIHKALGPARVNSLKKTPKPIVKGLHKAKDSNRRSNWEKKKLWRKKHTLVFENDKMFDNAWMKSLKAAPTIPTPDSIRRRPHKSN